jgi:citrate lyase subunit beta/citryl-CoA lyase
MTRTARPRRSVLYMPGSNIRALDKARSLAADSLILDLEDSVSPEVKAVARGNVVAALSAAGYGYREVVIRINALASPWGYDDLAAAAKSGADAVLVPKVESADGIRQVEAALRCWCPRWRAPTGSARWRRRWSAWARRRGWRSGP